MTQSYPDGYGAQYDKLLHLTNEPVDGGVKKPPFIFSIEYQVSRCPKHRMSCGQEEYPHLTTCVCGGALLRLKFLTQTLGS